MAGRSTNCSIDSTASLRIPGSPCLEISSPSEKWRVPKMVEPPNHPRLNNFSIEPMLLGIPHDLGNLHSSYQNWRNYGSWELHNVMNGCWADSCQEDRSGSTMDHVWDKLSNLWEEKTQTLRVTSEASQERRLLSSNSLKIGWNKLQWNKSKADEIREQTRSSDSTHLLGSFQVCLTSTPTHGMIP